MAFLDTLGKVLTETGQSVVNKTKDIGEITKLSAKISELERKMDQTYKTIGKLYVEKMGDDPDPAFAEMVASIKDKRQRIANYREDIRVLRGIRKCEDCGAEIEAGASFCGKCGSRVNASKVVADVDGIFADEEAVYEEPEIDVIYAEPAPDMFKAEEEE